MIIVNGTLAEAEVEKVYYVNCIDDDVKEQARQQFEAYKRIGAIENDSFDDDVWVMNNEVSRRIIRFEVSEFKFRRFMEPWTGCSLDDYKDSIKVYAAFLLGRCNMEKIGEIATSFRNIAGYSAEEIVQIQKNVGHITEMLRLLPSDSPELERVIEYLDEYAWEQRVAGEQRKLAEFNSYIRFNSVLKAFWENADKDEKLTYFPVYLWWNLTAILPLRPGELIRTPRQCLNTKNGKDMIRVRRSRLKGGGRLSYRIDDDYDLCEYPINKALADEIRWYLECTDESKLPDNDTLFSIDAQQKSGIIYPQIHQRSHYSYVNLVTCLDHFIKNKIPGDIEVRKLNLGDTRHIAMMNLIISGGSPSICKELAGHADINISSHYYSNFSTLIESAVFEEHRHMDKRTQTEYAKSLLQAKNLTQSISVNGGWCMSQEMRNNSVKDCLKSVGKRGEVGECRNCQYYSLDAAGTHIDVLDCEKSRAEVREDSWFLMNMIEMVRKGLGCEGDIQSAVTRLQHSCAKYRKSLEYQYAKEEM